MWYLVGSWCAWQQICQCQHNYGSCWQNLWHKSLRNHACEKYKLYLTWCDFQRYDSVFDLVILLCKSHLAYLVLTVKISYYSTATNIYLEKTCICHQNRDVRRVWRNSFQDILSGKKRYGRWSHSDMARLDRTCEKAQRSRGTRRLEHTAVLVAWWTKTLFEGRCEGFSEGRDRGVRHHSNLDVRKQDGHKGLYNRTKRID